MKKRTQAVQRIELEHIVHQSTNRCIRHLRVEVLPEAVVLRGQADSFYVKQLAQEAVREFLPGVRLLNAIVVVRQAEESHLHLAAAEAS
jgi:hypothetical protein